MQLPVWTKKQKILLASLLGAALLCVLVTVLAASACGSAQTAWLDEDPAYDENKYLDEYGSFVKGNYKDFPITVEYKGRTKVTLCGKEYVRDTFTLSGNEGVQTLCFYARKLDDNLMSVMEIYFFGKHTAEEYEKIFG